MYSNPVRVRLKASLLASSPSRRQLIPSLTRCRSSTCASRHCRRRHRHHGPQANPTTAMAFSRGFSSSRPQKNGSYHDVNENSNNSNSFSDINIPVDGDPFVPDPNMTLQQVHEARMAHLKLISQQNASLRAQSHQQKVQTEQMISQQRREERLRIAKRQNVAKFAVPYLLSSRRDLFALVMNELDLSSEDDEEEQRRVGCVIAIR